MQHTRPEYTSIAELAARCGTSVPCAGNLPVKLDDPDSVWFIDQGAVNLFLVESKDGVEQTAPQHLLRRQAGWLLPSVAPAELESDKHTALSLIAKGLPGTLLKRLPASLLSEVHPAELAEQTDTWLTAITDTLSRFTSHPPGPTALAEPGLTQTLAPGTLSVRRGVVWVSEPPRGESLFMGILEQGEFAGSRGPDDAVIPLTRTSWLTLFEEATISSRSTETLAQQGKLLPALASFHAVALALERLNRQLAMVDDANLERARTASRRTSEKVARQRLYNIYDLPIDGDTSVEDTSLADALQIIGRHEGIEFKIPARSDPYSSSIGLVDIVDASGVRARRVRFKDEDSWWRGDSNALLAFRAEDGQPVALLPGSFGRYREIDPASKRSVRVTADRAAALGDEAWMFYRPLPSGNVRPADLLRIALHGSAPGSGAAGDCRSPGRPDQAAAGTRAWLRRNSRRGRRKRRGALCRGRGAGGIWPAWRIAAHVSKHDDDAAGGALGLAGRSCRLGPPHAPAAKHSAPPSSRRFGHVGNDIPEASRWLAGNRRR